jgi:hypothetical protein
MCPCSLCDTIGVEYISIHEKTRRLPAELSSPWFWTILEVHMLQNHVVGGFTYNIDDVVCGPDPAPYIYSRIFFDVKNWQARTVGVFIYIYNRICTYTCTYLTCSKES